MQYVTVKWCIYIVIKRCMSFTYSSMFPTDGQIQESALRCLFKNVVLIYKALLAKGIRDSML